MTSNLAVIKLNGGTPRPKATGRVGKGSIVRGTETILPSTKRSRAPRRKVKSRTSGSLRAGPTIQYRNTLNNPWAYPGVRLGYGTMQPTALALGTTRAVVTPEATAAYTVIVMNPSLALSNNFDTDQKSFLTVSRYTATGTFIAGTFYRSEQATSAQTMYQSNRTISAGLAVTTLSDATKPAMTVYGNCYKGDQLVNMNPQGTRFLQNPMVTQGFINYGLPSVECLYRPAALKDYDFGTLTDSDDIHMTLIIAHPTNQPQFIINCVSHQECLLKFTESTNPAEGQSVFDSVISRLYPSIEALWGAIGPELVSTVQHYLTDTVGKYATNKSAGSAFQPFSGRGRFLFAEQNSREKTSQDGEDEKGQKTDQDGKELKSPSSPRNNNNVSDSDEDIESSMLDREPEDRNFPLSRSFVTNLSQYIANSSRADSSSLHKK